MRYLPIYLLTVASIGNSVAIIILANVVRRLNK